MRSWAVVMPKRVELRIGGQRDETHARERERPRPASSQRLFANCIVWARTPQAQLTRLHEVVGFGSNPGRLRMFAYVPEPLPISPALVVVLHGCLQTAAGYDLGAGWSTLADRFRFALLFPEQQRANNPRCCFNWFQLEDSERDRGEALSIRQMTEHMILTHGIDRQRVFVTGLSAGGAMTSVMLATYPEVFAAGAVIAGVPYRGAVGVPAALSCMFQGRVRSAREWGDLVRTASAHRGPWPKVSVWHGSADLTVAPANATEIIKQWTDAHGLPAIASRVEIVDGYPRRIWANPVGEDVIEEYIIPGMAHGTPIAASSGEERHGAAGPFLLDVGIPSSYHIVRFWGLTRVEQALSVRARSGVRPTFRPKDAADNSTWPRRLRAVATRVLRAAGLLQ
jgi:poly(hydroxyalkanoate) depolymerase family esterase